MLWNCSNSGSGANRQAVDIYERLARDNPQRFETELAVSLHNLAVDLDRKGEFHAAVVQSEEAIGLIAPYAERSPESLHGRWHQGMVAYREELLARLEDDGKAGGGMEE